MARRAAFALAASLAACQAEAPGTPPAAGDEHQRRVEEVRAQLDRDFVVFRESELRIEQLEAPVPAPITVGSRPSPVTMASSAPEVVSVQPDGALVAHRAGSAVIQAAGTGSRLTVVVLAPQPAPAVAQRRGGGT